MSLFCNFCPVHINLIMRILKGRIMPHVLDHCETYGILFLWQLPHCQYFIMTPDLLFMLTKPTSLHVLHILLNVAHSSKARKGLFVLKKRILFVLFFWVAQSTKASGDWVTAKRNTMALILKYLVALGFLFRIQKIQFALYTRTDMSNASTSLIQK